MAALVLAARSAPAWVIAADLSARRSRADGLDLIADGPAVRAVAVRTPGPDRHLRLRRLLLAHELQVEHARDDVGPDRRREVVEHLECGVLVLDQRVALSVRLQADALAEVLH